MSCPLSVELLRDFSIQVRNMSKDVAYTALSGKLGAVSFKPVMLD